MERKDVLRTKKMIADAYIELIRKNKKISVNSIIEKAGISRSTFYAHYQDIPALDECIENKIVDYINDATVSTTPEEFIRNPKAAIAPLLQAQYSNKDIMHSLIVGGWKPLIMQKIRDAFDKEISWGELGETEKQYAKAVNTCIKGVLLETCYYWAMNDDTVDCEQFIDAVCEFIAGGMANLLKKEPEISGE